MIFTTTMVRRAGVATVAVGLAIASTAAPTAAMKPTTDRVDCIEYGAIPKAPKGAIPRDDHQVIKQDPLKIEAVKAAKAAGQKKAAAATVPTVPDPNFDVTVPVRFHEIIKTNGNGGGDLSDARIAAQIDALNVGYAGTGFTFELAENTETVQPEWFNLIGANGADLRYFRGGGKEVAMKKLLADDDPATLDVYSASLGQSLLGWAYFPSDFTEATSLDLGPLHRYFDGVVIDFRSVPVVEGDTEGDQRVFPDGTYEEGDTLTHEIGHWLELYHTFEGGCTDNPAYNGGDQIEDTPAEASPNFFCPEPGEAPRDTCPADPGLDPINNFMDYSFDVCLTEFTDQQAARMQFAWATYRS
jgi:Pregnancy-associated plasma protein-A